MSAGLGMPAPAAGVSAEQGGPDIATSGRGHNECCGGPGAMAGRRRAGNHGIASCRHLLSQLELGICMQHNHMHEGS